MQARDAEFSPYAGSQRDRLQRLAFLLTGDANLAAGLATDAFARAYGDWARVGSSERGFYLVCTIVRMALGAQTLGLASQAGAPPVPEMPVLAAPVGALLSIPPRLRAVALLHHYERLDETQICRILEARLDEVRADLGEAESSLTAYQHTAPAGS